MDDFRIQKAQKILKSGTKPYAATFNRSHTLADATSQADGTAVRMAGRVKLWREMGK